NKADRIAAEGSTYIEVNNNTAVLLEVNCETDFVTKNDQFKNLLAELGKHLVKQNPSTVVEALEQPLHGEGDTVKTYIKSAVATIAENIALRRLSILTNTDYDAFGAYLHMGGRIGALSLLEGPPHESAAKHVAMHAAAFNPRYV